MVFILETTFTPSVNADWTYIFNEEFNKTRYSRNRFVEILLKEALSYRKYNDHYKKLSEIEYQFIQLLRKVVNKCDF